MENVPQMKRTDAVPAPNSSSASLARRDHFRMVGEAQIVVGRQHQHGAGFLRHRHLRIHRAR